MKPRIKRGGWSSWICEGGGWTGNGTTPSQAYRIWRNNRKIGRLRGIQSIRTRRAIADMRIRGRQLRIKEAQRDKAEVIDVKPPVTWVKRFFSYGKAMP